LTSGITL